MAKTIIKQVSLLLEREKESKQSRIVQIETAYNKRRGIIRGINNGSIQFSWIPDLDPKKKRIDFSEMDIITILCEYNPNEIISIK